MAVCKRESGKLYMTPLYLIFSRGNYGELVRTRIRLRVFLSFSHSENQNTTQRHSANLGYWPLAGVSTIVLKTQIWSSASRSLGTNVKVFARHLSLRKHSFTVPSSSCCSSSKAASSEELSDPLVGRPGKSIMFTKSNLTEYVSISTNSPQANCPRDLLSLYIF